MKNNHSKLLQQGNNLSELPEQIQEHLCRGNLKQKQCMKNLETTYKRKKDNKATLQSEQQKARETRERTAKEDAEEYKKWEGEREIERASR